VHGCDHRTALHYRSRRCRAASDKPSSSSDTDALVQPRPIARDDISVSVSLGVHGLSGAPQPAGWVERLGHCAVSLLMIFAPTATAWWSVGCAVIVLLVVGAFVLRVRMVPSVKPSSATTVRRSSN
jgi:hypothetical protein